MPKSFLKAGLMAASSVFAAEAPPEWRPFQASEYRQMHALEASGDTIWAGFDSGIARSLDAGLTWTEAEKGAAGGQVSMLAKAKGGLAAGQWNRILQSGDGGRTWETRDTLESGSYFRLVKRNDTLFAFHALFGGPQPDGIRVSADGGLTWKEDPAALGALPEEGQVGFRGNAYSISGDTVWRASGTGREAVLAVPGSVRKAVAAGEWLFVLTRQGLCLRSPEGRNPWSPVNTGFRRAEILELAADAPFIAIQTPRGIFLSRNGGRDWECVGANRYAPAEQQLSLSSGRILITSRRDKRFHRYSIAASSWDTASLPLAPAFFTAARGRMAFTGAESNSPFYYSTGPGDDLGTVSGNPHPALGPYFSDVALLLWRPSGFLLSNGWISVVSDDTGRTWKSLFPQIPALFPQTPAWMAALAEWNGAFYAFDWFWRLWRFSDADARWEPAPFPIPERSGVSMDRGSKPFLYADGNTLYAGEPNAYFTWTGDLPTRLRPNPPRGRIPKRGEGPPVLTWPAPGKDGSAGTGLRRDAKGAVSAPRAAPR